MDTTTIEAGAQVRAAIPKRYVFVLFAFSCTLINLIDRVNFSVVAPVLAKEQDWNPVLLGTLLAAFFWGYSVSPIPGGWLADRFGGKKVLGLGAAWWSLCTFLTPIGGGLRSIMALRVLLGLGEGVNSPATQSLTSRWFPIKERTRAVALYLTGSPLGTIIAFPLSTWIVSAWGWKAVFYVYGGVGGLWVLLWFLFGADSPETHRSISPAERDYILAGRGLVEKSRTGVPWTKLLRSSPVWALMIMTFSIAWMVWLFLSWLPYYLMTAQHFSLKQSGIFAALPFLANMVGFVLPGWLQDRFIAAGHSVTLVRKIALTLSSLGAVLFLLLITRAASPARAVAYLTAAMAIFAAAQGTVMVNSIDIGPRHAGVILGMQATAGNAAGALSPIVAGLIVQKTGSFSGVFYLISALLVGGVIVWNLFASGEQVLD